jgi:hypothetical protein
VVGDAAGGVDARRTAVTTTPSATETRDASLLKTEPAYGRFRFTREHKSPLSLKLSGMRAKAVGAATCRHERKGRGMAAQAVGRAAKLQLHVSDCAADRSVDAKQTAATARGSHHHAAHRADGVLDA